MLSRLDRYLGFLFMIYEDLDLRSNLWDYDREEIYGIP